MATSGDWLVAAFFEPIIEARQRREADPGLPAYAWLPDGSPSFNLEGDDGKYAVPLSFVATARERLPVLINLDQLRRSTLDALAGKPDTRTPQQRSRDDWAAYLRAKERFLGKASEATQEEDGAGPAQEPAPGPAEEGPAPREEGPDRDDRTGPVEP